MIKSAQEFIQKIKTFPAALEAAGEAAEKLTQSVTVNGVVLDKLKPKQ